MIVPLSEIVATLESGVSVNSTDIPANGRQRGILKVSCVAEGRFFPEENKLILPSEADRVTVSVKSGDLLVTRANTFDLIASCGIADRDYQNLFLSDKLWRIVLHDPNRDYLPWLSHVLCSPSVRDQLKKRATGTSGSMKNIPQSSFLSIPVYRPMRDDQVAIANLLSVWDRGIRQLSDLIAAKLRFKQGLMQQLLCGKLRLNRQRNKLSISPNRELALSLGLSSTAIEVERGLNGKSFDEGIPILGGCPSGWQTKKLVNLLNEVQRPLELKPQQDYQLVTAKRYRAGIVPRERLKGKQIKTATQFKTRAGDFLISRRQIVHGACGLVPLSLDGSIVSNEYSCLNVENELDPVFLEYLTHTKYLQRTFYQSSVGVTVEKMIFRLEHWLKYDIHLPPLDEQRQIVNLLSAMDREIVILDRQQKLLAKQKKGLMQRLLTGELRVAT